MTTTTMPKVERKGGGMPHYALLGVGKNHEGKWTAYWPYTSDVDGERFLTRFIVFRTPLAGVEITRIHKDDLGRPDPHDHSRTFLSWKFGRYNEWVFYDPDDLTNKKYKEHRKFGIHRLRHTQAHMITHVSPKLVTVLFTGKRSRQSNYWTAEGLKTIGMGVDQEEWA